ncbi:SPOR domain-containing protein [Labrys wisconsinensis]|nr:SPOR domain-containing protein [Labrys wisconsinensis]
MNRRYARDDFAQQSAAPEDPLAELARIVNKNDPFADLFNEARTAPAGQQRAAQPTAPADDLFEGDLRGSYDPQQETARTAPRFRGQAAPSYGGLSRGQAQASGGARAAAVPIADEDDAAYHPSHAYAAPADGPYTETGGAPLDDELRAAPYVAEDAEEDYRQSRGRGIAGIGILVGLVALAAIGGGAAYAWKSGVFDSGTMMGTRGEPPLIVASKEPTKIKPEAPASTDMPTTTKEIFDRVSQDRTEVPERIMPREEQPVAIAAAVPDAPKPAAPPPALPPLPAEQTGAVAPPPLPTRGLPAALAPPSEPRRVKTVKVLADGTIVTGEAQAAPSADPQQPVVDAGVPSLAVPQITTADTPLTAPPGQAPAAADTPDAAAAPPAPRPVAVPPVRPKRIAAAPVKPAEAPPAAPAADQPHMQVASLEASPPEATGSGFVVQVSSQKSQADAIAAFQALQRKFPAVVGGMKPSIKKAEVGDKGTFYRVRVGGWQARDQATTFCVKLKAAGGDCVVTRN